MRNYISNFSRQITISCMTVLMVSTLYAQTTIEIEGAAPHFFVSHTVAPKENWYSIGRIYNASPKEIAPFNELALEKPLAIGQKLKVPLSEVNFSQNGSKLEDEVFVPVYHKVKEKEWMYRISSIYSVSVPQLEQWNRIKNDQLKTGMNLIVGYLKVKTSLSSLAQKGSTKMSVVPASANTAVVVATPAVSTSTKEVVKTVVENKPVAEPKKDIPTVPVAETVVKTAPKELQKPMEPIVIENSITPATPVIANHNGGVFRKQYASSIGKSVSGNSGVFKSTSGWNDGKYYALMNDVPVGTIVKISFSSTQKTVYAKVLGALPDMKESVGLTIRISDAAASELGANNSKFFVDILY